MKLLLDQGLPRSAAILLRESGLNAIHVGEIGFSSAEDSAILRKAREEEYVLVTLDADFHALLALSGATSPSVIRIRREGLRGKETAELIRQVIHQCEQDLEHGALVSIQISSIRIRHLPLV